LWWKRKAGSFAIKATPREPIAEPRGFLVKRLCCEAKGVVRQIAVIGVAADVRGRSELELEIELVGVAQLLWESFEEG
jgi:hypothetical protein